MYSLVLSVRFQKELAKITTSDAGIKKRIAKVFRLLNTDIDHPSLRLHKLSGLDNWSVSVTRSIRIIFHIEKDSILLLSVGKHEEVY